MAQPHFLDLPGQIFRVLPDWYGKHIVLEIRKAAEQSVTLVVVPLEQAINTYIRQDLDWWWSLVAVGGNWVLLHKYPDPQMPIQEGALLLDLEHLEDCWTSPSASWAESQEYYAHLRQLEGPELKIGIAGETPPPPPTSKPATPIQVPEPLDRSTWEKWPFLQNLPPLTEQISHLQTATGHLLAWHHQTPAGIQLRGAYLKEDALHWQILLESYMQKLNPEPFFVVGDYLIWLGGSQRICWIHLNP